MRLLARWQYLVLAMLFVLLILLLTYTGQVIEEKNLHQEKAELLNAILEVQERMHEAQLRQIELERMTDID